MAAPGQPYFVDNKKGEVNELRVLLQNPAIERDPAKKREVLKRVVAYMTLGIDVSRLFTNMIMATNTKDLVQKKMVYLYLCNYAEGNAELALLAINTLQKDCRDEDPMVRGLALRALTGLRLSNIVEYSIAPIKTSIADPSPYVRKSAVLSVLKIFRVSPKAIRETDLIDTLYTMLRDRDTNVVSNSIAALNEILEKEGGMALNKNMIHHFLNRLRDFVDWGQCQVLELVARYNAESDEERFDIMNLLDERLKIANSAVIMAVTKVFLNLTAHLPQTHLQVYSRLKAPLLTLVSGGNIETAYVTLSHIKLLVERSPASFVEDYKRFFCRYSDPISVKLLKLEILTNVAVAANIVDIVSELGEYVTDVDSQFARCAIQAIGKIGMKTHEGGDQIVEHLLRFIDLGIDYVSTETVIVMKDLLRKYPERHVDVIPALGKCLTAIDEPVGKVSVIWMIGEYGEHIDDSPYILEPLIDNFAEEPDHSVRSELLTATMKLFFKRPPECQKMLGRLLDSAIGDGTQQNVHDRALLYYRLLQENVSEGARIVNCAKQLIDTLQDDQGSEVKDRIFDEFNTLSVVYGKPSEQFLTKQPVVEDGQDKANGDADSSDDSDDSDAGGADVPASSLPAPSAVGGGAPVETMNLLDLDIGSLGAAQAPALQLTPAPSIAPDLFQRLWGSLSISGQLETLLPMQLRPEGLEAHLATKAVGSVASGTVGDHMKFYFYAQEAGVQGNPGYVMGEVIVNIQTRQVFGKFKSENPALAERFAGYFRSCLQ